MDWGDERIPARVWDKLHIVTEASTYPGPCWIWAASTSVGYGQFAWAGKPQRGHRVFCAIDRGGIPEGLHVDHLCEVKLCMNPAHLEPVTSRTNTQRAMRDVCRAGLHSMVRSDGTRFARCPECTRQRDREFLARTRGESAL